MTTSLKVIVSLVAVLWATTGEASYNLKGRGNHVTKKIVLEKGLYVVHFEHDGMRNFIANAYRSDGQPPTLVANEIGTSKGSRVLAVSQKTNFVFQVQADGDWRLFIDQPKFSANRSFVFGHTDMVSPMVRVDSGTHKFRIKHEGRSNFIVYVYNENWIRPMLLVNEIGRLDYIKRVQLDSSAPYVFVVTAGGKWSITFDH